MTNFVNEAEIQNWLEREIQDNEGLWECVENFDYLESFKAQSIAETRMLESYTICTKSMPVMELIAADNNISLTKGEILKPDLLLYAPETQSFFFSKPMGSKVGLGVSVVNDRTFIENQT